MKINKNVVFLNMTFEEYTDQQNFSNFAFIKATVTFFCATFLAVLDFPESIQNILEKGLTPFNSQCPSLR